MSANQVPTPVTVEEYLEHELHAEFKSEYFNGEVFPIVGAAPQHAAIVSNVVGTFWQQLRSKPCRVYTSGLMLRVTATGLYAYPDVAVLCGDPQFVEGQTDVVTNPALIVEVLSPSTQDYDRARSFVTTGLCHRYSTT
jgi:Uma2 family endonuclease